MLRDVLACRLSSVELPAKMTEDLAGNLAERLVDLDAVGEM